MMTLKNQRKLNKEKIGEYVYGLHFYINNSEIAYISKHYVTL